MRKNIFVVLLSLVIIPTITIVKKQVPLCYLSHLEAGPVTIETSRDLTTKANPKRG